MLKYFLPDVIHKDSRKLITESLIFLLSGKFLGLMSPYILRSIVNMMTSKKVLVAAKTGSNLVFWKAGLCVLLWGATRVLSTALV